MPPRNSRFWLLGFCCALMSAASWLLPAAAVADVRLHSINPGATQGEAITANGDLHQFRVALTKATPLKSIVVRGNTYWQVNEDAGHYYAANVTWVLPGGLTAHPAWAQWGETDPVGNDLTQRFEITTQDPQLVQNTLGYLITVKGKRVKVGTGGGGGNGEISEEDWGSSFTGQALESFDPSTQETVNGQKKTILGSGTVTIKGIASAGQKVDLTYHPFSYTITVQRAGDQPATIINSGARSTPLIHDSLGDWNVDALKPDGSRQYPAGDYTVTLTVTPSGQGGEGGTVTTHVTVTDPQVTFTGLARACAGGIAVDGVHDFTITATAKESNGTPLTNTQFKLSFKNNRGHDYSNDSYKPAGWTMAQIKRAKFVTMVNGTQSLTEEWTATTDNEGKISVHVLSSDIISGDIKVVVNRTAEQGGKQVGEQACDFAEAVGKRGWPNQYDPEEPYPSGDDGWLINQQWLDTPGEETTAKMYLQFKVDLNEGDVETNWKRINGHKLLFEIDHIDLMDGGTATSQDEYATLVDPNAPQNVPPLIATGFDGSVNGAATVLVRAGTKIDEAGMIWLIVYDESQWDN
jgi:hypothetical protein